MKKHKKRLKAGHRRGVKGTGPESENQLSKLAERSSEQAEKTSEKAGIDFPLGVGVENKLPLGEQAGSYQEKTSEKAGVDFPLGVEDMLPLGGLIIVVPKSENKQPSGSRGKEEKKAILGFACPDCLEYELALAEIALKFYELNNQDAPGFEVVEVSGAYFRYPQIETGHYFFAREGYCHISFRAKVKNSSTDDEPMQWFYSEFKESPDMEYFPIRAEILDPYDDGIMYGCWLCPAHAVYPRPPGTKSSSCSGVGYAQRFNHHHKCEEEEEGGGVNGKDLVKGLKCFFYLDRESRWNSLFNS